MNWREIITDEAIAASEEWSLSAHKTGRPLILEDVDLRNQNLAGARLQHVHFIRRDLSGADLSGTMLGQVEACVFDGARLVECRLPGDWDDPLTGCSFRGADLTEATFDSRVDSCDFEGARLVRAIIVKLDFTRTSFFHADLAEANLRKADFEDCDFRSAKFTGTIAGWMGFEHADFRGANFDGMRIDSTHFVRCGFHGAYGKPFVEGSYFLEGADLSPEFDGSIIDAGTIERAWGPPPPRKPDE